MILPAHLEAQRLAKHPLELSGVTRSGPELQLGIAGRAQLQERVLAAIAKLETCDCLGMAPVEAFREAQGCREGAHGTAVSLRKVAEAIVPARRCGPPMVASDERDDLDLRRFEPTQIAVGDEVMRMLVMPLVADVHADVVQERGVLEPFALAVGQAVEAPCLIEEGRRQPRDLLCMLGPVVTPLGQFDDAAAADVRVEVGLGNRFPVAGDVVEDETFAQREIAERQLGGAQAPHDRVEQDGPGDGQVGTTRLEPGHAQTPFER
jgi:hypothetical protein